MANFLTIAGKDSKGRDVSILWVAITNAGVLYLSDLLTSNERLGDVSQICDGIRLGVVKGVPVVIVTPSSSDFLDLSGLLSAIDRWRGSNLSDEQIITYFDEMRTKALNSGFAYFPDSSVLWGALQNKETFLDPYFAGTLHLKIAISPTYFLLDREEVAASVTLMNSAADVSTAYIGNVLNRTLRQEKCTDRLFIELPKYEVLRGSGLYSPIMPQDILDNVFTPFANNAYYGPYWLGMRGKPEVERIEYYKDLASLYGEALTRSLKEDQVWSFVDYPESYILGSEENNDLPVCDNELDYYNSLVKLIKFDLETCYPDTHETLFKSGALTPHMKEYLEQLLSSILLVNWSCAGMFRVVTVSADDESGFDNDGYLSSRDSDEDEFIFHNTTNPGGLDGLEFFLGWLRSIVQGSHSDKEPLGCAAYAEAIVKVARWGERRPDSLILEGNATRFSLRSCREEYPRVDFSKLYPIEIDGRMLELQGIVESKISISDPKFVSDCGASGTVMCPVGVITVKSFTSGHEQLNYVSLADIVIEYQRGNQFISGIDLVDGNFLVNESKALGYVEQLSSVVDVVANAPNATYYHINELASFSQDVSSKVKVLNDLHLIYVISLSDRILSSYYNDFAFSTKDGLRKIVEDFNTLPERIAQVNISNRILPLYLTVSDEWDGISLSSLLGLTMKTMQLKGIQTQVDFYSNVMVDKTVSIVSQLTAFTDEKKEGAIMVDISSLLSPVGESDTIYRVDNGSTQIGFVAQRKEVRSDGKALNCYIFASEDEVPSSVVPSASIGIDKLMLHVWRAFASVMSNKIENPAQVRFASQQTASRLFAAMKSQQGG